MKTTRFLSMVAWLIFMDMLVISHDVFGQRNRGARRMDMVSIVQNFEKGDIAGTLSYLQGNPAIEAGRDKLLYYLQLGQVLSLQGEYAESNEYFEKAYHLIDDARKNIGNEVASILTNATAKDYRGEHIEVLLINYYKTLNFIQMQQFDKALVECRQMDIRLHQLNDRYSGKNKFNRDAFVHLLMGIIHDAMHDPNNAFIAYRNALEIYQEDYGTMFSMAVPEQLKFDLVRTAMLSGLDEEARAYEAMFNVELPVRAPSDGEVLFFWNNGLAPVKVENSITFATSSFGGGMVFVDEQSEESFSFPEAAVAAVAGLTAILGNGPSIVKVAFPKYQPRDLNHTRGHIEVGGAIHTLSLAEDISQVAERTLQDRWAHEMGQSLLRLAAKQLVVAGAAEAAEEFGGQYGSLLSQGISLFGRTAAAATEKADTRAWTSMPANILYSRIPLPEGDHVIKFVAQGAGSRPYQEDIEVQVVSGQTTFYSFTSFGDLAGPRDTYVASNDVEPRRARPHAGERSTEVREGAASSRDMEGAFLSKTYFTIGGGIGSFGVDDAYSGTLGISGRLSEAVAIEIDVEGIVALSLAARSLYGSDVGIKLYPGAGHFYLKPSFGVGYLTDYRVSMSYYDYDEYGYYDDIAEPYEDVVLSLGGSIGYQIGFGRTSKTRMDVGVRGKTPFSVADKTYAAGDLTYFSAGVKFMF